MDRKKKLDQFIKTREKVDSLLEKIVELMKRKQTYEAKKLLEECEKEIADLKLLAEGRIQTRIVQNRTDSLIRYQEDIEETQTLREAGKREDGSIAVKCNWNDAGYKGVCSEWVYRYNRKHGGPWCQSVACRCRDYVNKETTLRDNPCYESIALKVWRFGAGSDHDKKTGKKLRDRYIRSIKGGKLAVFTSLLPDAEEEERFVIALVFIKEVRDDPGRETIFFGDPNKSLKIDYQNRKLKFWDFYQNPNNPGHIQWSSGLFRYLTNKCVLSFLKGVKKGGFCSENELKKARMLIDYFKDL